MNDRERFVATMHYKQRDRSPICDFGFWPETIEEWHKQGLPKEVDYRNYNGRITDYYFGMDQYAGGTGADVDLCPDFGWTVIEDRGDQEVVRDGSGVSLLRQKYMGSIPIHLDHLLKDRQSWEEHFKHRLDPSTPERYPKDWDAAVREWTDPKRDYPATIHGGSLFGRIRDMMGMENVALLVYDDPSLFEEMVTTLADLVMEVHRRVFATGAKFDGMTMWEDMCYNAGPLLSPTHFKKYLVPHYKRITEQGRKHGVDVVSLDCDGKIDELLPLWLDAGVNCMFPIEVGTWGADPIKYRKQYGKELLMIGGFDKHILARGRREIEKEIDRLTPLVEEGGFIPLPDHRVPPDVPFANYWFYLETARQRWGKGINLKPMGKLPPK